MIAVIGVIALVGLLPGLLLLAVLLPFFLLTLKPDMDGQTPLQRIGIRAGWRRARWGRSHLYRSGPLGTRRTAPTSCPGCWPPPRSEGPRQPTTGRSRCCASPWVSHLTVVLATEPDGAALVDQQQVDSGLRSTDTGSRRSARSPAWSPPGERRDRARHRARGCARRHQPHRPSGSAAVGDRHSARSSTATPPARRLKARVALTFSVIGRRPAQERQPRWPTSSRRGCRG